MLLISLNKENTRNLKYVYDPDFLINEILYVYISYDDHGIYAKRVKQYLMDNLGIELIDSFDHPYTKFTGINKLSCSADSFFYIQCKIADGDYEI
jgi:hypothetical protein